MLIDFKQLKLKDALVFFSFPAVFYIFPRQVVKFFQFFKNLVVKPPVVEPDLAARPNWANYLAQSVNGYWKWYKEEPKFNKFGFWVNSSKQEIAGFTSLVKEYTSYINLNELLIPVPATEDSQEERSSQSVKPSPAVQIKKRKTPKKQ